VRKEFDLTPVQTDFFKKMEKILSDLNISFPNKTGKEFSLKGYLSSFPEKDTIRQIGYNEKLKTIQNGLGRIKF